MIKIENYFPLPQLLIIEKVGWCCTGYNFITINWISTAYCAINRMVIYYPVDYAIHPLNNWIFDIEVYLTFGVNRNQHLNPFLPKGFPIDE